MTPKNYLDFINNYKRSLASNRALLDEMAGRLSGGLQKLIQAATEVDAMQKELSEAKVVVEQATQECNELLVVIGASTTEVESKAKAAVEKEAQLKVDSENISVEKAEAEAALEEAIPALEEAAAALADLRKDDITEIRSFAKPHVLVQKVRRPPSSQGAAAAQSTAATSVQHARSCLCMRLGAGVRVRGGAARAQGRELGGRQVHDGRRQLPALPGRVRQGQPHGEAGGLPAELAFGCRRGASAPPVPHAGVCRCIMCSCVRALPQVKKVKDYMKDSAFTYESLKTISIAGAGLLKWVLAMVNYNNVARTVEPKRKKVADAEKNLRIAQVRAGLASPTSR